MRHRSLRLTALALLLIPSIMACSAANSPSSGSGGRGADASNLIAGDAGPDPLDAGSVRADGAAPVPPGPSHDAAVPSSDATSDSALPDAGGKGGGSADSGTPKVPDAGAADGWVLTWADEFDGPEGSAPDPSKWVYDTGGSGFGNNELEYYTNDLANAHVTGGNLAITATPVGASSLTCWNGACQYTSARINTSGKFSQKYGRFESRIKIPEGSGVWPAFWLLGDNIGSVSWPACGEIDIMENIGKTPNETYGTTHGPGPSNYVGPGLSKGFTNPSGTAMGGDFHVFSVDWSASSVAFSVDGNLYWTVTPAQLPSGATWVWDHPFFIILNFAVGGGWPGNPDGTGTWPQTMLVDYVRVYQASQ